MRLNFSASAEQEIDEGIRRIGQVIWEQVQLYETLTGELPTPAANREQPPADQGGDVVPMRRRAEGGS